MKIGIAGVGRMGGAMAERLLDQGHEVLVWNRTPARVEPLVAKGAVACPTPAALAAEADTVITCLTDQAAIEAVYDGPDGLLSSDLGGRLMIEMSTLPPEVERALAERVRAVGGAFVECPVGGTVAPALAGKLFGFPGGEDADVARARPVLELLCRRLEHVGPVGAGSLMKLAINLPLAVYWQVMGEALTLCRGLGLDGARVADIFADTSGTPTALRNRAEVVARVLSGEEVTSTVDVGTLHKDLGIMLAAGEGLGARMPASRAAKAAYDEGLAAGIGPFDGSSQAAFWRDNSGA